MIELLTDLWELVVGLVIPDYILEAFNWFSFVFLILIIFAPLYISILVLLLVKNVGKYD